MSQCTISGCRNLEKICRDCGRVVCSYTFHPNQWISIADKKPPNELYVLTAFYDGRPKVEMHFIRIACRMNDAWVDDHDGELLHPKWGIVTHWMPLPDKPETK